MGGSAHASFTVGGIVIAGGIYAYLAKKSLPSLYGSLLLGSGLIAGGLLIANGNDFLGHTVSATSSTGLIAVGVSRYLTTKKAMPAAPLALLGIVSTLYNAKKSYDWSL